MWPPSVRKVANVMTPDERKEHGAWFLRYREQGDMAAFERLLDAFKAPLLGYLTRMLGNPNRAEDAFQEVWLRAIRRADSYEEQGQFSSWLYRIAHNYCLDEFRRQGRENTVQEPEMESDVSFWSTLADPGGVRADERIYEQEIQRCIDEAVERLPERVREIYLLRTEAEVPFKELAEMFDCPLGTVLGWMHQAMKRIRKHLLDSNIVISEEIEPQKEKIQAAQG